MINYYEKARTQPQIFSQLSCKDLLFVKYDCPLGKDKQDTWSMHNYILYIVTGTKAIHTPARSWTLTKGVAVFIKKGACIIEKIFGEELCLMAFFIPDDYLRLFLKDNMPILQNENLPVSNNELVIPLQVNEIMEAYYESVIPYFSSEKKPHEDLLELKFRELLLNVLTNPSNIELNSYLQTLLSHQANNLQTILEANCYYNLTLEDYARLCYRSLSSFKRDFQKIYKTAPAQWLLNKRLNYAHQLLLSSDKKISDISLESGFENIAHFCRVFKNRYHLSPLQYRMQGINFRPSEIKLD